MLRLSNAALRGLDLSVAHGEVLAIMGPSSSGKSRLLQRLGAHCTLPSSDTGALTPCLSPTLA
ncbi:MAG: ATP-binding cassette domain-containing protein [Pseudomonadota bacterium]